MFNNSLNRFYKQREPFISESSRAILQMKLKVIFHAFFLIKLKMLHAFQGTSLFFSLKRLLAVSFSNYSSPPKKKTYLI